MIQLYQFPAFGELPNLSAFSMKVETYLRMTKLPFEVVAVRNPRKSPKGKLPYIMDDDKIIGDSSFIIDYLKEKYGDPLDADLTSMQKAHALAFQRLLEEHFYFVLLYSRWGDQNNWPQTRKLFFSRLSKLTQGFIANSAHKYILNQMAMQGIGRHSMDEIYHLGCEDITAVATALGEQKFFLGITPTSIDACVYAFIANVLQGPFTSPLRDHAELFPNLSAYCERMKSRFYAESI